MHLLGKTNVKPKYATNLYYVKGNNLMEVSKSSGRKTVVSRAVFPISERKPHNLYYAKVNSSGKLSVYTSPMKRHGHSHSHSHSHSKHHSHKH